MMSEDVAQQSVVLESPEIEARLRAGLSEIGGWVAGFHDHPNNPRELHLAIKASDAAVLIGFLRRMGGVRLRGWPNG